MKRIVVALVAGVLVTGCAGAGPTMHEGSKVTAAWAAKQIYASYRCRDGSSLAWTSQGYWNSRDHVFHEAPDVTPGAGPDAPLLQRCIGH